MTLQDMNLARWTMRVPTLDPSDIANLEASLIGGVLDAAVAQRFAERERQDLGGQRPAAEAGGDLRAEQLGRGPGNRDVHLGVREQAAHVLLPARHVLDFVEEKGFVFLFLNI